MTDHEHTNNSWRKYTPCGCLLLMFGVGVALPVVGWMIWSANAARMVEAELDKIRAAGEPIDPEDLDSFYRIPEKQANATRLWVVIVNALESESFRQSAQDLPIVGSGPEIPPVGEPWEQLEAVEEFLELYQDEMNSIHEAVALGGYARFDRDFGQGISMLLPNVQGVRSAARMLVLEARVAAHRGDSERVTRAVHGLFATCNSVAEDPITISHLVRVAIAGIAAQELEVALESVELSSDELAILRSDVQAMDLQRGLERSLMGERVVGMLAYRNPAHLEAEITSPIPVRANNEDLTLYLSTLAKCIEASREPFPMAIASSQAAEAHVREVSSSGINRMRYVFTNLLMPAMSAVFQATGRGIGTNSCTDTALAIEQYRLANGSIPASLDELVPAFISSVPIDPMDGKPLRYIVTDSGYTLYSVGRNQVDDGGVSGEELLDEVFSVQSRIANPLTDSRP